LPPSDFSSLKKRSSKCLPAFSRPCYEGWPHLEQSFSIDVCLPHSLLVLLVTTQSTILCCRSMSSWVYFEYGCLGLYLVLIPSPDSPLSFSICAHSMLVSFLSQTQVDFLTFQLSRVHVHSTKYTVNDVKRQQQNVRILQSLTVFKMSTLSFKTSLRSLCKLLYIFVNRTPRQAVADHLQRFLEFDYRLRYWMTLVISSNVAYSYLIGVSCRPKSELDMFLWLTAYRPPAAAAQVSQVSRTIS